MRSLEHSQESIGQKHQPKRFGSLTAWARAQAAFILNPLARAVGRSGVHPNVITVLGFLLQVGVGWLFYLGRLRLGGWLLLAVAPMDALDGALARATGKESRFGAFLDSTLDRLSDATLILGLTAYHLRQGSHREAMLLLLALVAALMVSYTRARAEALGFSCRVGLLTRLERVFLIGALSALGLHAALTWSLSGLSIFTLIQRILYVHQCSKQLSQ